ncbi:MAG: cysteine synthase A [Eubacteriales bacterium]|nr:cysteine synthase A [Eubacteriales bacterium]
MAKIYQDRTELIGGTPLLQVNQRFGEEIPARILAKMECFNPAGSAKDRIALAMVLDAESKGLLRPGSVIIEPTSGNTGIGLAAVAAQRGYRAIFTMPETMSVERRELLKAFGAEIVLTPGPQGMQGAVDKADELSRSIPDSIVAGQFINPANPAAHYATTGPEIWQDTDGQVDIFVAGVGTGGTISGAGRYLKKKNPAIRVVAVEPLRSPLLSQGKAGPHGVQGIGANFVPAVLDTTVYDEIIPVGDAEAMNTGRHFAHTQGILVGISSGAALWAAYQLAKRPENAAKTIVVMLPDTGERYLSTAMFQNGQ